MAVKEEEELQHDIHESEEEEEEEDKGSEDEEEGDDDDYDDDDDDEDEEEEEQEDSSGEEDENKSISKMRDDSMPLKEKIKESGKKGTKDSEPVKEEEEDDEECIGSLIRKKVPSNACLKNPKVKKEETGDDYDNAPPKRGSENNPRKAQKPKKVKVEMKEIKQVNAKPMQNGKIKVKIEELKQMNAQPKQNEVKKLKKVYDLPGQKRDVPEERDPLRIFYESLHDQVPNSEMAAVWMMESGLLPEAEAKELYEKIQKSKQQRKLGSPLKSKVVTGEKHTKAIPAAKKTPSRASSGKAKLTGSQGRRDQSKKPSSQGAQQSKNTSSQGAKQSKKRKKDSDEDSSDDDDDFVLASRVKKKQRAA